MNNTSEFRNKVIMITGANRGIGKGIADYFHEHGALLALGVRNMKDIKESYNPERCLVYQLDVREQDQLEGFYLETLARFGKIDVLVNNAGIDKPCALRDIDLDYLHDMMSIN